MTKNPQDRRVQKTRQLLQDALVELISEKGYQSVTVQEILDRANVGRSTFYAHFQDKDQLLHSCLDSLKGLLVQHTERLSRRETNVDVNANLPLGLFEFAGQHHRFFKVLLGKQGNGVFNKMLYDQVFVHAHVHIKLMLHGKRDSLQSEIVVHYAVSAFMGILVWWVENDMPCSADEIGKLLRRLTLPGLQEVLGSLAG